jgi:hypothetical protein
VSIMIEGVEGFPGSGKTYYAIWRALREIKKGRIVYSNMGIKGSLLITPQDLITWLTDPPATPNGNIFVVLDEAQNWFGARNWRQFSNDFMEFFSQTRKRHMTVLWVSQDQSSIDKTLRDRTHLIHNPWAWFTFLFGRPLFFTLKTYAGAKRSGNPKYLLGTKYIWFKLAVAESYDTNELVKSRYTDNLPSSGTQPEILNVSQD